MEIAESQPLVIDNGSFKMKVGFAGDDFPRGVFPSVVGRRRTSTTLGMGDCVPLVADQALSMRNVLDLFFPVERGIVNDWDVMEELWDYAFNRELRVSVNEHAVLLTEPQLNPKPNREKMTQIMFEKFEVPAMYVANPAVLALLAINRHTGVVLDSGDGVTTIVPVYEGHAIQHAITRLDLAGRDLTDYLMKLMNDRGNWVQMLNDGGITSSTDAERGVVRDIKEKLCYVALDYEQELVTATNTNTLVRHHDEMGVPIEVNSERFRCPEALFQPSLLGLETAGIHEHINNAILKCEDDLQLRRDLYGSIVLAGGNTMFPGMTERLRKELLALAPADKIVKVLATPERRNNVWIGGSCMAVMWSMQDKWITKREYEECGAKVVHRKCF